ncbi:MAG: hypothetical protein AAGF11_26545 [Myxococcota bacterium]
MIALLVGLGLPGASWLHAASPASEGPAQPRRSDTPRIAVVVPAGSDVAARLVAELRFLGFVPEIVEPSGHGRDDLIALARARAVAAAIAVDTAQGRVEVTIVDRMTGKLVSRELVLSGESADGSAGESADGSANGDSREIAVRSVELLRASLLELERAPSPPEAEVTAGPAVRRTLRRSRPRLSVGAGAVVGGGPGGVPVAVHARAYLRYTPHPYLGVVVLGNAPLHAVSVVAPEGTARLRTGWLGVGPRVALRPPEATVVPDLAVVAGAAFMGMQGVPAAGYQGARSLVADAVFEGSAGVEIAISPRIRARLSAAAAVCARTVRVRFAGRSAATWCRPQVLGSLGIGVVAW